MFKSCFLALTGIFIMFTCGCVIIKEYPAPQEISVNPAEHELAKKLLQAFIKNDAKGFIALLPEETQSKFTVKNFATTRKAVIESVGEPAGYAYVTTLKLDKLNPQIWKVTFKRNNVNNTREYTSEVLFKVVTGMENDKKAVILSFHFL
ncbi:MAG: hypothetical protein IKA71_05820 [Lentisphaeria bacterium]|nr:hypothetical protein [Lentisphaeria bacterium]